MQFPDKTTTKSRIEHWAKKEGDLTPPPTPPNELRSECHQRNQHSQPNRLSSFPAALLPAQNVKPVMTLSIVAPKETFATLF
jgi:hypothetical protein